MMAGLIVPEEFAEWFRNLPERARTKLSLHDLRQIWEPIAALRRDRDALRAQFGLAVAKVERHETQKVRVVR